MRLIRTSAIGAVALTGALAFSACGSASNTDAPAAGSGAATSTSATSCFSGSLSAAGSTAQQNAFQQATSAYQGICPEAKVSYNGTGSGAGITSFLANQIDFAGSDSALNADKGEPDKAKASCGSEAWNLPMVTGPIAVSYNLKGVDKLVLTPDLIAKIFSGQITAWNDPAIAAKNSGATLPTTPISVFFRSDSSGTTDNFTNFMHTVAPSGWTAPHDKTWKGGVGQGKAQSAGVSQALAATDGGITYVEWSFAIQNKLSMAQIDSGSGPVELTAESAAAAVGAAKVAGTGNDLALKIDYATKASGAYPIILVTYEIVCSKYTDAAKGTKVKAFLTFLSSHAFQSTLTKVGSAPLPKEIQSKVQTAVAAIS
ncbi:phosphate ABC transporter substrate-binding protein PstS [Lapillicoccus sp.]|uniref:phosphate ABC transporter substrate-binding protein PstS n=1 Tax=Lapillicoccus sp. TaxID=1909287 RepID=UPI003265777E